MKQTTEYWRDCFDRRASNSQSDYLLNRGTRLRLSALESAAQKQFLEAVDPKPQDVILDAGCGSGRNIALLSPLVREIVGLDYSEQMLQRARERIEQEKLGNVSLSVGDVTALRLKSASFDKVVCASVLQYLDEEDCAQALHEMARVCKPGGRLILHVKNGTSLYGLSLRVLRPLARLLGKKMKPEFYRSAGWHERRLKAAGGSLVDYDGFGILNFVPLPQWLVGVLLRCETAVAVPKVLKKVAVNYKMTIRMAEAVATQAEPRALTR